MGGRQVPGWFETRFEQDDQVAVPQSETCGCFGFSSLLQGFLTCLGRFLLLAPVVSVPKHESRFPLLPLCFLLLPAPV